MVVIYVLRTMKDADKKAFTSVGIIMQLFMTILLNEIVGGIFGI